MSEDTKHIFADLLLAEYSTASLSFSWHIIASVFSAIALCVYLILLISACAPRSDGSHRRIFELPHITWAYLLVFFLLVSNITTFANIYIKTEQIQKPHESIEGQTEIMSDEFDAIYFSAVTVTTLGYGEFLPSKRCARIFVLFQLFSGVLLLLFAFPILASRTTWKT